jgi:solute:Na+ symporter, SSS family
MMAAAMAPASCCAMCGEYHELVKRMQLTALDWSFVALYFLLNLGIGFYYKSRAGSGVEEFFLSGRNVPWWLAGLSMVATTFAADTPLVVTGLVATKGIAGNWLWWNMVASGMMTVFLYARLWRRSGVTTDLEFCELRYSGGAASTLRWLRALYLGIPINCIILGWVNLAMVKILGLVLGLDKDDALLAVLALIVFTSFISTLSGLWGVLVTDAFQFFVKMGMVIVLAWSSVSAVGGIDALMAKLRVLDAARAAKGGSGSVLDFSPDLNSAWMPALSFFVFIGVSWWASWYPGAEPGGGGYVAQRMFSAKDERHSLMATLFFNVAHYALRPWPWILTALASMVLYPDLADPESGYVRVMMDHLPSWLRGLMLAAFAAAYMSTIATQLNWGASYLVNDVYRRFLNPNADEKALVRVSQAATILLTVLSIVVTYNMESITGAWELMLSIGAGTGLVYLLRWYWWRINAWSEVAAMATALIVTILLRTTTSFNSSNPEDFAKMLLITVAVTTVSWLAVTFLTRPESNEVLINFYRRTHPSLGGWRPIARLAPDVKPDTDLAANLGCWLAGCIMIYGFLLGMGKLILRSPVEGTLLIALGAAAALYIYRDLNRRGWSSLSQ